MYQHIKRIAFGKYLSTDHLRVSLLVRPGSKNQYNYKCANVKRFSYFLTLVIAL